jgi:hypothetical protein
MSIAKCAAKGFLVRNRSQPAQSTKVGHPIIADHLGDRRVLSVDGIFDRAIAVQNNVDNLQVDPLF